MKKGDGERPDNDTTENERGAEEMRARARYSRAVHALSHRRPTLK